LALGLVGKNRAVQRRVAGRGGRVDHKGGCGPYEPDEYSGEESAHRAGRFSHGTLTNESSARNSDHVSKCYDFL
jgi:hypothetical protein